MGGLRQIIALALVLNVRGFVHHTVPNVGRRMPTAAPSYDDDDGGTEKRQRTDRDPPPTGAKEEMELRIESLDRELEAVEVDIRSLEERRAELRTERSNLTDVFDELRFEISRSTAVFNAPILAAVAGAGLTSVSWKYLLVVASLYQNDAYMEADWLPESVRLLTTLVPRALLRDYYAATVGTPLLTMAATSCVSYAIGDIGAQVLEGRRRPALLDLVRCARNAALGFVLHGPLLYGWILVLEGPVSAVAGGSERWTTLVVKIVLDQTVFSATINMLYAFLDGVLADRSPSEALFRAREVLVPSMVQSWRFWPVVHLISYSPLIPVNFKVLWIDLMEIIWVAILSATVNDGAEESAVTVGALLRSDDDNDEDDDDYASGFDRR